MESIQTPRVLAPHLQSFQFKLVRILGKVVELRGETAVMDAGGNVDLILMRDSHLVLNHAFEVIGKVDADLRIKVQAATDFGTNIDYNVVAAVVDATHRFKTIFYSDD